MIQSRLAGARRRLAARRVRERDWGRRHAASDRWPAARPGLGDRSRGVIATNCRHTHTHWPVSRATCPAIDFVAAAAAAADDDDDDV